MTRPIHGRPDPRTDTRGGGADVRDALRAGGEGTARPEGPTLAAEPPQVAEASVARRAIPNPHGLHAAPETSSATKSVTQT